MSGVKCTSKKWAAALTGVLLAVSCILTGCGGLSYDMAYVTDPDVSSFNVVSRQNTRVSEPFAANLCVVSGDVSVSGGDAAVDMDLAEAAVLFDVNNSEVLYAKNAHEKLSPASLTKVMTALVALENGSLDQKLTATSNVLITEARAQLIGLKVGDTMTLDQALRVMLLYSANDVAMLVAEGIGGTVDNFIDMMNAEARRLGATNTNFENPHGLTQDNHYTTAYDLYLIFNEAVKNETFSEIIQMSSYQTTYYDANGKEKEIDKQSTNLFHQGKYQAPSNVTVIGGKTGTTQAAGYCLMLLARDVGGAPYISIILRSESSEVLYAEMIDLLGTIHN